LSFFHLFLMFICYDGKYFDEKERNNMKKKILITIGSIIAVLVLGIGGYAAYLYHYVQKTADKMYEPVADEDQSAAKQREENLSNKKPISILLMGVDEREGDVGRSDTLMVMTVNPKTEKMQIVSIPRDTKTEIIGEGKTTKINAAYAYGGVKMALDTVENFTNIDIDYYAQVNMEALSDLVDAVGGITVNNELDWIDEGYYKKGYHYEEGNIQLDGPKALGYVRMRHLDPNGDFGRNERQRKVLTAIIDKAASISSVSKFDDILNVLGSNVKTNMTFDEMMDIQKNYRGARNNIEQYEVTGTGDTSTGTYYLVVSDEEKQKVHDMLADNLEQ